MTTTVHKHHKMAMFLHCIAFLNFIMPLPLKRARDHIAMTFSMWVHLYARHSESFQIITHKQLKLGLSYLIC